MKIAVVGPANADSFADNVGYTLRTMGHDVLMLGPARPRTSSAIVTNALSIFLERLSPPDRWWQRRIISDISEYLPDLVITLDRTLHRDAVSQLRMRGIKVVLWFPDHVSNLGRHELFLAPYDRIYVKNPVLAKRLHDIQGLPVSYLPEACNPSWHRPIGEYGESEHIAVVGNVHPTRAILLNRLIGAGIPLRIYGQPPKSWIGFPDLHSFHEGKEVSRLDKSRVFRSVRGVLNNLHPGEFAGVNCRLFEATAAGGVVLTEDREGLRDLFSVGTEVLTFAHFDELVEICKQVLSSSDVGRPIADAASKRSLAEHSYENRLSKILVDML